MQRPASTRRPHITQRMQPSSGSRSEFMNSFRCKMVILVSLVAWISAGLSCYSSLPPPATPEYRANSGGPTLTVPGPEH